MRLKFILYLCLISSFLCAGCQSSTNDQTSKETTVEPEKAEYAIVIHGGAGTIQGQV